jgi:SAM-dependent methyltransferase
LVHFPEEVIGKIIGERAALIPPKSLTYVGTGDFAAIGQEFLRHFVNVGGLKPTDRVLDVGCGNGRMAVPLTRFLNEHGSYEGFDIVPAGIAWCQKHITPRFPRFRFDVADIYNAAYNPKGREKASDYIFPYPPASFDFVFLSSVFTHMLPADMENYLRQIERVLKPGGRCFITYFLITPEVGALIKQGASTLLMREQPEGYSTIDRGTPEYDIAFPENAITALFGEVGLELVSPVYQGWWSGRSSWLTYQDVVVAENGAPNVI